MNVIEKLSCCSWVRAMWDLWCVVLPQTVPLSHCVVTEIGRGTLWVGEEARSQAAHCRFQKGFPHSLIWTHLRSTRKSYYWHFILVLLHCREVRKVGPKPQFRKMSELAFESRFSLVNSGTFNEFCHKFADIPVAMPQESSSELIWCKRFKYRILWHGLEPATSWGLVQNTHGLR